MFNLWRLFDTGGFMPHGMCYLWNPTLIRLHLVSDLLIGASYVAISLALARFAYRAKQHIPFSWIFVGFGVFLVACGATHFMEIWTLWTPVYWLSGAVKVVTAAASVTVAITLPALLREALPLIRSVKVSEQRKLDVEVANESLRKQISEREAAERKFRQLLESAPDAMVVMNQEGAIVLVNAELERLFGYPREELLNQPMEILMPAGLLDRLPGLLSSFNQPRLRAMGPGLELFGRRKDGSEFPVEISLSPLETEEGTLVSSAIRDISERKREERKFRQLLESAPDAMVVMNQEGAIVLVNAELERLFGYQREELLNQPMETLMPAGLLDRLPGLLSSFNQPRLRAMGPGLELFGRRKDGSEFPVEISLSPLETEEGTLVSSAIRDISERKRAEHEIEVLHTGLATRNVELATSNQELEAFTSSVAHDLRAPLRHIQAFSMTLIEGLGPHTDPSVQGLLRQLVDTTRNMAGMVDDLLSLARLGRQELSLQVTGLHSLVQETIKDLAPELKDRQIDWRFGELPFVDCDPALIKQVLFNLLSNAVKYTMPRKPAVIEVGIRLEKGQQIIFVKDNGVGFNMKYADKLFGVFRRLHRREDFEGVGVGLAAAQRIIHKHGGRIWAAAEVDKGATFSFTLSAPPNHETKEEQMLLAGDRR